MPQSMNEIYLLNITDATTQTKPCYKNKQNGEIKKNNKVQE